LTVKRSNLYRQAFPLFCTITVPSERDKQRLDTTQNPADLLRIDANSFFAALNFGKDVFCGMRVLVFGCDFKRRFVCVALAAFAAAYTNVS